MVVVRLAKPSDLNELYKLLDTEARVMTTMPKTKADLKARIDWSQQSSIWKSNFMTGFISWVWLFVFNI
jgi:arginine/ornithine N-succinyltransferase beta subunit